MFNDRWAHIALVATHTKAAQESLTLATVFEDLLHTIYVVLERQHHLFDCGSNGSRVKLKNGYAFRVGSSLGCSALDGHLRAPLIICGASGVSGLPAVITPVLKGQALPRGSGIGFACARRPFTYRRGGATTSRMAGVVGVAEGHGIIA